jgi:hypothetical protein
MLIVYQAARRRGREAWYALPAVLAIGVVQARHAPATSPLGDYIPAVSPAASVASSRPAP